MCCMAWCCWPLFRCRLLIRLDRGMNSFTSSSRDRFLGSAAIPDGRVVFGFSFQSRFTDSFQCDKLKFTTVQQIEILSNNKNFSLISVRFVSTNQIAKNTEKNKSDWPNDCN
uniref:(northern house mosquito) hypothetical protein n=1 Tax=Culex pipiens TaxID=7175 RepID=A0A8D8IHT2_CULPI